MPNYTLILFLFLLFLAQTRLGAAQSVAFTKDQFGADKEGLKEAQRELKAGDTEYRTDPPRYAQALTHFLTAQQLNPNNAA